MTDETEQLTEPQEVILRVLQELQESSFRTELVKYVYFTDYIYYQHTGRTLTGLQYMWDSHGPNAISGEIVREADALAQRDLVRMKPTTNVYGDSAYMYRAEPGSPRPPLDAVAGEIIKDVVRKYRKYGVQKIAAASKRTAPFRSAQPGDILTFDRESAYHANPPQPEDVHPDEIRQLGEGKSLAELRTKYGIT